MDKMTLNERIDDLKSKREAANLGEVEVDSRGKWPEGAHNVLIAESGKIICDSLNSDMACSEEEPDDYGGVTFSDQGTRAAFEYLACAANTAVGIVDAIKQVLYDVRSSSRVMCWCHHSRDVEVYGHQDVCLAATALFQEKP